MPHPFRVLVVDDDPAVCAYLRDFLTARGDEAITATNADEAIRHFADARPSVVLLDVVLPGARDGLSALTAFRQIDRQVPVIVISGVGRTGTIVQAMTLGAADVLPKPLGDAELTRTLDAVLTRQAVRRELADAHDTLTQEPLLLPLVGESESIVGVRALVSRLGRETGPVLIRGERGTGKGAVARALHQESGRRGGFIVVNGATAPRERIDVELCGVARDGAAISRPGAVDFAREGTLFIRELADVPAGAQRSLVQLLRDGAVTRVSGRAPVPVDVRLIASTHRDLEAPGAEGSIDEDLLLRLSTHTVTMPPLRERPGDIAPLATRLLRHHAVRCHRRPPTPGERFMATLERLDWPGNIRQMDAAMRQLVLTGDEEAVLRGLERSSPPVQHIVPSMPARLRTSPPEGPNAGAAIETTERAGVSLKDIARSAAREAERELILQMLTRTRWNRKEAAESLGISYKALLYKIKENGLDKAS